MVFVPLTASGLLSASCCASATTPAIRSSCDGYTRLTRPSAAASLAGTDRAVSASSAAAPAAAREQRHAAAEAGGGVVGPEVIGAWVVLLHPTPQGLHNLSRATVEPVVWLRNSSA